MKKSIVLLAAFACFVVLGAAAPAHAALVTFASGNGNDAATCLSPATACRQISAAIAKTDPFGTVHVLAGTYDFFTIFTDLSVIAEEGTAVVLYSGGNTPNNAIVVNAHLSQVLIKGLEINIPQNGAGSLLVASDPRVIIEDCTFRYRQGGPGIDFQPSGAGTPELTVKDTTLIWNDPTIAGPSAIRILPGGNINADVLLDNVTVRTNTSGIHVDGRTTSGALGVIIRNSVMSGSTSFGLRADESGPGTTNVMLESSTASNNGTNGVIAVGNNAVIRMRNSTSTGNGAGGLIVSGGGQIISHGGNVVAGNTTNGSFTGTFAQQ